MQKVISNSSPIIHLAKIDQLELLKEYFQVITIPPLVKSESISARRKHKEMELIKNSDWIVVSEVKDEKLVKLLQTSLDYGESEAIVLALESNADLILLDDLEASVLSSLI